MSTAAQTVSPDEPVVTPDGQPIGQRLSELQIPEKWRKFCEDELRRFRYSRKERQWVEGHMKLDIFYGGQFVVYLDLPDDWVVIAHGYEENAAIYRKIKALPPELRSKVVLTNPLGWDD